MTASSTIRGSHSVMRSGLDEPIRYKQLIDQEKTGNNNCQFTCPVDHCCMRFGLAEPITHKTRSLLTNQKAGSSDHEFTWPADHRWPQNLDWLNQSADTATA
jgi:hypothetical protein